MKAEFLGVTEIEILQEVVSYVQKERAALFIGANKISIDQLSNMFVCFIPACLH